MLVEEREGKKTLRLAGDGWIEVATSESLYPADSAWTAEVGFKAEKPDGVLLARGGKPQGYALWLKQGRPVFTVVVDGARVRVEAKDVVTDWTTGGRGS